jgi:hypothetical protein
MNTDIFERLKMMPPLSHWPDRPSAFRLERSEVVQHIRRIANCDLPTAQKLFGKANAKRVIRFDRSRMTWVGNRNWVPMPTRKRSDTQASSATGTS